MTVVGGEGSSTCVGFFPAPNPADGTCVDRSSERASVIGMPSTRAAVIAAAE